LCSKQITPSTSLTNSPFTVFPAAFVAFFPAEVVRQPDLGGVLGMLAAALVYATLAVVVFDRGLRRYRSGNRLLELR